MSRTRWTALAVALLAAAVYANSIPNGFALDDEFIIVNNERVHGVDRLPEAISEPYWPNAPGRIGLFRPLTTATFAIEWELWGQDPRPFHVTNVTLHVFASVLVFALLLAVLSRARHPESDSDRTPATLAAAAGAAVFAVHPVHTEAVANVVGRAEVLAAVFVLAAAILYVAGDLTRTRRRLWAGAVAMAGAYFLGLVSKEIAVTLPALLLVLEAGRGAPGFRVYASRVLEHWPVYVASGAALVGYLVARSAALGTLVGNDTASFLQPLTGMERLMTAISVWPEYLRLMVFPVDLVADYSPGVLMPVHEAGPELLAGLLVGLLAGLVVAASWRRCRVVALGVVFFGVAVLPVSNLVVPIGVLLAERTLYLPSVGLAFAVAGGWVWVSSERPRLRPVAAAVLALVVILAGARTWIRVPTWRSTETVMATLAADHPESFRVQWLLAGQLQARGRAAEALERYEQAVGLLPGHYQLEVQYATALLGAGRLDEAIGRLRTAVDAVPELPEAHVLLMVALLRADRAAEAVDAGQRALKWHADHRGVYHQLAIALTRTGEFRAALRARRESVRLAGDRAAHLQFVHEAELLLRLGRREEAATALAEARERAPDPVAVPTLEALAEAVETADPAVLPYR
ncbi:MAG: tetratricopeptide repeat protein [Longimicrobiales bacterium]